MDRMTDASENITFPQILSHTVGIYGHEIRVSTMQSPSDTLAECSGLEFHSPEFESAVWLMKITFCLRTENSGVEM